MHHRRELSIRSVRRPQPDLRRLSRALIALVMAQAQAEADAQADRAAETAPAPDAPTEPGQDVTPPAPGANPPADGAEG